MKKNRFWMGLLLVVAFVFAFSETQAQDGSDFTLRLRRDWGYGSGADIQGNMTLYVDGELDSVERVVYYIDDAVMVELADEPFRFSFNTDNYEPGIRQMRAEIRFAGGTVVSAGPITYNFLSAAESGEKTTRLIVIIAAVTLAAVGISQFITSRQKGGQVSGGGMYGLAICNSCGQIFPRSFLGLNIVVGKFERCPHCGKWQVTRRAAPEEIEQTERQSRIVDVSKEPILEVDSKPEKDALDDSRFIDM